MPKTLKSGARQLVLKLKSFCEREKRNKEPIIPLKRVRLRVATMTDISEKTVSKITKEGEVAASTATEISTPGKHCPREKRVKLDDFELCALRHKIHEFYVVKKELLLLNCFMK
ncbi:unnamed protein product [Chrysodeixis includens]|uniref:Uncharacterized protein n=1 Tax=Chrysodeixis includens TaxID=689277 RepID=A0A9N8PYI0_CHRIL|nr:unnamed protein product [Chrysodeixis includens]